jgi:hypothetical protein
MAMTPQEYTQIMVDAFNARRTVYWDILRKTMEQNDPYEQNPPKPLHDTREPSCEGKEGSPVPKENLPNGEKES